METTAKEDVKLYDPEVFSYIENYGTLNNTWYNTKTTLNISMKGVGFNNCTVNVLINMHGSGTGCGFGVIGGWCSFLNYLKKEQEAAAFFVETIKKIALTHQWHCLLATCGGSYLGTKDTPSNHEKWIQKIGFKEVNEYINLRDGPTHRQKVYICDTKDLKIV